MGMKQMKEENPKADIASVIFRKTRKNRARKSVLRGSLVAKVHLTNAYRD